VQTGENDEARLNGRLMREWVQVCRQEDHGKCSAGDADRTVQTRLWHILCTAKQMSPKY